MGDCGARSAEQAGRITRAALAASCLLLAAACTRPSTSSATKPTDAPSGSIGPLRPGTPQTLRDEIAAARGRPVVVNFWASWCIPCIAEIPRFVAAAEKYRDEIVFIGVDVQDVSADAKAFARQHGVPFPSIADSSGNIRRSERVLGLPTTHFYDANGKLAFAHSGEIQSDELERKLQDVLRVAPSGA
jgi:cytochrome c biogenesis protein CcmG/thiol:disulfide interchange protein DsbE